MERARSSLIGALVPILVVGTIVKPAECRTQWKIPTTFGSIALGTGLAAGGAAIGWSGPRGWDEDRGGLAKIGLITGLGVAIGGTVAGWRADSKLARGEELSGFHRGWVATCTVLSFGGAGAVLGAMASGGDTAPFVVGGVLGIFAGSVAVVAWGEHLSPKSTGVTVTPSIEQRGLRVSYSVTF